MDTRTGYGNPTMRIKATVVILPDRRVVVAVDCPRHGKLTEAFTGTGADFAGRCKADVLKTHEPCKTL